MTHVQNALACSEIPRSDSADYISLEVPPLLNLLFTHVLNLASHHSTIPL